MLIPWGGVPAEVAAAAAPPQTWEEGEEEVGLVGVQGCQRCHRPSQGNYLCPLLPPNPLPLPLSMPKVSVGPPLTWSPHSHLILGVRPPWTPTKLTFKFPHGMCPHQI